MNEKFIVHKWDLRFRDDDIEDAVKNKSQEYNFYLQSQTDENYEE